MRDGLAYRIRACISRFRKLRVFSAPEVAILIREPSTPRVTSAFRDFMDRGEIVRVGLGRYQITTKPIRLWSKTSEYRLRLISAMHVSGRFSASDIALLSDATKNFTHKVVRELRNKGDIVRIGGKEGLRGQIESVYQVKSLDDFFLKYLMAKEN